MTDRPLRPRLSARRRWGFRLMAVLLSLLGCFLVLEVVLRFIGPEYYRFNNTSGRFYSNPRNYFDLIGYDEGRPVYGIRIMKATPHGGRPMRMPDDTVDIAAAQAFYERPTAILGLGDSFTYGWGVRFDDTYLRRVERRLAADGLPASIRNMAMPAVDLQQVSESFRSEAAVRRYPLVVYGFVLNDFGLPHKDRIVGFDYIDFNNGGYVPSPWRQSLATVNFVASTLEKVVLSRVTRQAYLDAFESPYADSRFATLADLDGRVRAQGGRLVILLFPLLYDFDHYAFPSIHARLADFCRSHDIPLLDLLPAYSKHRAEDLWVHPTDHHPNEVAHAVAADELYTFLRARGLLGLLRAGVRGTRAASPPSAEGGGVDPARQGATISR
jgi:lysophospholipase L1-like esterase